MELVLTNIPIVYINLDKDIEKKENIESLLQNLGFKNVVRSPGVAAKHKRIGVAHAHVAALSILKAPFIIIEDDCNVNIFKEQIIVPDSCDGVFLGHMGYTSTFDLEKPPKAKVNYEKLSEFDDLYRIFDVLSAHAILYLSQEYVNNTIKTINNNVDSYRPHDVFTSRLQKQYFICSVGEPIFYQNGVYKEKTNKHLTNYK